MSRMVPLRFRSGCPFSVALISAGNLEWGQLILAATGPKLIGGDDLIRRVEGARGNLDFIAGTAEDRGPANGTEMTSAIVRR
jgi:hypothetical protein